jgi:penicillin-binding protein 2
VDLKMAIAESCDVYFYDLAHRMTIDTMHDHLARFGLGAAHGHRHHGGAPGRPALDALEARALNQPWYPGETLSAGIGQGYMLATPLQLAVGHGGGRQPGRAFREPRLVQWLGEDMLPAPSVSPWWPRQTTGMRSSRHARGRAR